MHQKALMFTKRNILTDMPVAEQLNDWLEENPDWYVGNVFFSTEKGVETLFCVATEMISIALPDMFGDVADRETVS